MLHNASGKSAFGTATGLMEVVYHAAVHNLRKKHGNALVGLFMTVAQTLILVAVFFVLFSVLGIRGAAIRGDFLLYIMTGIFLFLCHIKAMSAVISSEGPTSPLMKHAPMNTIVAIFSAALGALYIQLLSLFVVLFLYHTIWTPLEVYQPLGALSMLLLAWFSGVAIGMVFLAIKPWFPEFVQITSQIYMRANMIASGKMFVANTLPGYMLQFFDWNPLFHTIDQARGYSFINYNPLFSNWQYALYVSIACMVIGLMGEFYTRQRASLSWFAKR